MFDGEILREARPKAGLRDRDGRFAASHGGSFTREYQLWSQAKERCDRRKGKEYADYGGRGITMCDRWRDSFAAFLQDMGPCPPGLTLDRQYNDGHYEPGNCRWATRLQQARNRRTTGRPLDLAGPRYERLTVLSPSHKTRLGVHGVCRCDCGREKTVLAAHLRNGSVRSCGCLLTDFLRQNNPNPRARATRVRG